MLLIHDSFYFFDSDRDAFLASETGAFRSNQNIVFQADASKIFEFFNGIKVQEVCMHFLSFPFVNQCWNKIAARFIGNHKAFLSATSHAQGG